MSKVNIELTQEVIMDVMDYNEETGICIHKEKGSYYYGFDERITKSVNSRNVGKLFGKRNRIGYIEVRLFNRLYSVHRLIWLYMTGEWPDCIDHINGIRDDNRWVNIRNVTRQENNKNLSERRANTSGVTGVSYAKKDKLWHAYINVDGKRVNLIWSKNKEEAIMARKQAEIKYGYHPNHGKRI